MFLEKTVAIHRVHIEQLHFFCTHTKSYILYKYSFNKIVAATQEKVKINQYK